jgi:N-acetylmuramoyl-L-alanine amidase
VKFNWLVASVLGVLGSLSISTAAEAARLQFWRFNANENRLVFTTDEGVQPRAQLISNPTRLVIDLPGVTLGRSMVSQTVGGAIREVRVGQFDDRTTRIVIELSPGYTLNPQEIQVRGSTPTQWTVELPTPQQTESASQMGASRPSPNIPVSAMGAATQLESLRVTADGFFIRSRGRAPEIELEHSRDRRQVTIDLANTTVSAQLLQQVNQASNRHGVSRLQITQLQSSPPTARITLELDESNTDWQATASNLGGIVLVPSQSSMAIARDVEEDEDEEHEDEEHEEEDPRNYQRNRDSDRNSNRDSDRNSDDEIATVQSVELTGNGAQLLIRADETLTYTTGWDRSTGAFRITIPSARLANEVRGPDLDANSPLMRVRLREEDDDTVVILVQPATGVRIGEVNQFNRQVLALQLQRVSQRTPVQSSGRPPTATSPPARLPRVPNSRIVIVVDPGHGGSDPGAIGIGGLREVDVVLPVALQVASLLEQQGVQVVLTRRSNQDLELEPRVQIAERANADLFVSIHANSLSLSRPDINGIESYYYSDRGARLARVIHNTMLQVPGTYDRGVRHANFYVLRNTSMPAVLLELGFVTGAQDSRLLSDPDFQRQMAEAIARGILQYVQQGY